MNSLRIYIQLHKEVSFKALLGEENIKYNEIQIYSTTFATIIELVGMLDEAKSYLGVIAIILFAWLHQKKGRRIKVEMASPDGGLLKIDISGYSTKDAKDILSRCYHVELTGDDELE